MTLAHDHIPAGAGLQTQSARSRAPVLPSRESTLLLIKNKSRPRAAAFTRHQRRPEGVDLCL